MELGELEQLLDGRAGIQQPESDTVVAVIRRLVEGKERTEAGAVDETRLGEIDFDVSKSVRQSRANLLTKRLRIVGPKLSDTYDAQRLAPDLKLHRPLHNHETILDIRR